MRLVFVLAVAVAGCFSQPKEGGQAEVDRLKCQRQIRSVAYCVFQYCSDHEEQFPETLEEAVSVLVGDEMARRLIQCPARGAAAKYIYINWSRWFTNTSVPKDYPLVYESDRGKHGDGINVVLMDGSVFWDEGCRWITDFARKHPEYCLEIPK